MNHTPGPWVIDKDLTAGGAPIITARMCWMGNKRTIAKVLYHTGSEDPEVDYNARLIAAAPDLLAALKALLCEPMAERTVDAAKKVIRKAEGKGTS